MKRFYVKSRFSALLVFHVKQLPCETSAGVFHVKQLPNETFLRKIKVFCTFSVSRETVT